MPPTPGKTFIVKHPNELAQWTVATDIIPTGPSAFEAFSRNRTLKEWFAITAARGYKEAFVTLEPWKPTPVGTPNVTSALPQLGYTNAEIAAGAWDAYLYDWARAARDSGLTTIYVRYGHEMNGNQPNVVDPMWYPWQNDPTDYVAAWKRVVSRFRNVEATNVRFCWSPNSAMFMPAADFLKGALPYWPGTNWVDVVGVTGIQFGPPRTWMGGDLGYRLDILRRVFGKPIGISELNCAYEVRDDYFRTLADWQRNGGNLEFISLSQHTSRGGANGVTKSLMNWAVDDDTIGRNAFGALVDSLRNPVGA